MNTFTIPDPTVVPDDVRFYYRHARRSQHPVLELGGVDGRYALPLVDQDIPVYLLAEASEHLEALGAFAEQRGLPLTIHAGSLLTRTLERTFGMIYVPAGRMTELLSFDEQLALLGTIREHLPIGGKLAFDVPVPHIPDMAFNMGAGSQSLTMRETHTDSQDKTTYVWERRHYDPIEQVETQHEVHEEVDAAGTSLGRVHRVRRRAYFWPREVRALLLAAGYMIEAGYGGFVDEPLTSESRVQVWLARRAMDT